MKQLYTFPLYFQTKPYLIRTFDTKKTYQLLNPNAPIFRMK